MSFISVFDVMGPNMIGPSSSLTAGAARIAFLPSRQENTAYNGNQQYQRSRNRYNSDF